MQRKIVIAFAHPDDESYGTGGTIRKYASEGAEVHLITATNGEGARIKNSDRSMDDLGRVRIEELSDAGKILGIKRIHLLNYPDGLLNTIPVEQLKLKIRTILKEIRPQIVITFERNGINDHPDHKFIYRATTDAFFELCMKNHNVNNDARWGPCKLYYLTFPKSWLNTLPWIRKFMLRKKYKGTADDEITTEIDISSFSAIKKEACEAHKSQVDSFNRIQQHIGEKYFLKESFILVNAANFDLADNRKEKDLFNGFIREA
jgi:N-acetyl-1-D-myo-inositol-2-amino-2-deoxy-alpha-D-glucopyranoside deacetylase